MEKMLRMPTVAAPMEGELTWSWMMRLAAANFVEPARWWDCAVRGGSGRARQGSPLPMGNEWLWGALLMAAGGDQAKAAGFYEDTSPMSAYAPFMTDGRRRGWFATTFLPEGAWDGIFGSAPPMPRTVRYCPECVLAMDGEGFRWLDRAWQGPGVTACHSCGGPLTEADPGSYRRLWPWERKGKVLKTEPLAAEYARFVAEWMVLAPDCGPVEIASAVMKESGSLQAWRAEVLEMAANAGLESPDPKGSLLKLGRRDGPGAETAMKALWLTFGTAGMAVRSIGAGRGLLIPTERGATCRAMLDVGLEDPIGLLEDGADTDEVLKIVLGNLDGGYEIMGAFAPGVNLWCRHLCGEVFPANPKDLLSGRRSCPCRGKAPVKAAWKAGRPDGGAAAEDESEFNRAVEDLTGGEYEMVGDWSGSSGPGLLMRHARCGRTFRTRASMFLSGTRCPACRRRELTGAKTAAAMNEASGGRYRMEKAPGGSGTDYIVTDLATGATGRYPLRLIRQELNRPTPSEIFAIGASARRTLKGGGAGREERNG